jgi:hypothetical protein
MKNLYFWSLVILSLWIFVFLYAVNTAFYAIFHLPFGMGDIDRYACWLGVVRPGCYPLSGFSFYVHIFFISLVSFLGGLEAVLWFVPLLLVVIPLLLFWFYRAFYPPWFSFCSVLFFLFGSYFLFFFWFTALYSELLAIFFVILSLGFYYRDNWFGFIVFGCLGVLSHAYLGFFFVLLLLGEYFNRGFSSLDVLSLGVVGVIVLVMSGFLGFFTPFSDYPIKEPNWYLQVAGYTCPLFFVFMFFTKVNVRYFGLFVLLAFLMPFVHLGRGMVFLHLFLCPVAFGGFLSLDRCLVGLRKWLFRLFVVCFLLGYSLNFFYFMGSNMLRELPERGLSLVLLNQ